MKVILTQDVEKLGQAMDIVQVADGYARNYLLPRSLAMTATKSAVANLENLRAQQQKREAKLQASAQEIAAKLGGQTLHFADANVGSGGRLYGSIGSADIAQAVRAQFGTEIDRRLVGLSEPIRMEGFYKVPLKLHRDVTAEMRVKVGNPVDEEPVETEAEAVAV